MTAEEIAKTLDEMFREQTKLTDELEDSVAEMIIKWDKELAPVKAVMEKYGLLFKNPNVKGGNEYGVVIGEDNDGTPLVLKGGLVARCDAQSGEIDVMSRINLTQYIKNRGEVENILNVIKAGFDYARKMKCVDENPIAERNKKLRAFLDKNA